jgi:ABC-type Fe3+-hydroxamate transport system substrate-binding protein
MDEGTAFDHPIALASRALDSAKQNATSVVTESACVDCQTIVDAVDQPVTVPQLRPYVDY